MPFHSLREPNAYSALKKQKSNAFYFPEEGACQREAMVDPGFPRGGSANSPWGVPTYDFAKFSQKLHEIERILTRGRPKFYYVDPPLERFISPKADMTLETR